MDISKMTIKEIKSWLDQHVHRLVNGNVESGVETKNEAVIEQMDAELILEQLSRDRRSGVRKMAERWEQAKQKRKEALEHWRRINEHERELRENGYRLIAGVDEVGRGPLAGPLVVSAVILPPHFELIGMNDSKQLSKGRREEYAKVIREQALAYSIVAIDAQEIDRINIYQATLKGMVKAVDALSLQPDFALIDAMKPNLNIPYRSIIKGDASSASIAAASILAKVERDLWMERAAERFPQYGFERNAGYATKEHLTALHRYGPCSLHRQTFLRPEQKALPLNV